MDKIVDKIVDKILVLREVMAKAYRYMENTPFLALTTLHKRHLIIFRAGRRHNYGS